MTATKTIDADVFAILRRMTVDGLTATLPPGQLERKLYERVDKTLKALGGHWSRKARGHIFAKDPRVLLGQAVVTGTVTDLKKLHGKFYTPPEIANRMVREADIRMGQRVLEPSCGNGRLVHAIFNSLTGQKAGDIYLLGLDIDMEAINDCRLEFGESKSLVFSRNDFLNAQPPVRGFDRVLMNPPFAKGQDIAHIRHALKWLKPGGTLVSLCAAGSRQRLELDKITLEIMDRSGPDNSDQGVPVMEWETLPADSFKASGTGVNVAMVILRTLETTRAAEPLPASRLPARYAKPQEPLPLLRLLGIE